MARVVRDITVLHAYPRVYEPCLCFPSRSWSSFSRPGAMEGWVDLVSWLHRFTRSKMVTHPSTNWAHQWVTSIIRPTTLTTTPHCQSTALHLNRHICGHFRDSSLYTWIRIPHWCKVAQVRHNYSRWEKAEIQDWLQRVQLSRKTLKTKLKYKKYRRKPVGPDEEQLCEEKHWDVNQNASYKINLNLRT